MSIAQQPRRRSKARRVVTAVHKWIGISSALIVVIIAVTGLMLNHTGAFKLDQKQIDARWLLDWYGLSPEGAPTAFQAGEIWIAEWSGELFINEKSVGGEDRLIGAGEIAGEIVAVFETSALLFNADGQLLEKIDPLGDGAPIQRAGIVEENLAIETANADVSVLPGFLSSEPLDDRDVIWFEPAELPSVARAELETAYRGEGLPLSRLMLDLHSGRLFGGLGVFLWDLAAIAFLVLVGTGLWLGLRKRRNRRSPEMEDRGPYADIS